VDFNKRTGAKSLLAKREDVRNPLQIRCSSKYIGSGNGIVYSAMVKELRSGKVAVKFDPLYRSQKI
jgi:hypothetical protein